MEIIDKIRIYKMFVWSLSVTVIGIAVIAWGNNLNWTLGNLSVYQLFPLLGLMAFSIMWGHYIALAVRKLMGLGEDSSKTYYKYTGYLVLALILLHPGLLIFQLWYDGFGFPPNSYLENYVAPSLAGAVYIGTVSWVFFIAFEFKKWIKGTKLWPTVRYGSDAAMIGIFIHGLVLGSNLQTGWYNRVWIVYGVTLVLSLAFIYYSIWSNKQTTRKGIV